ncbi:MAG: hypothetical protein Kow0031_18130 [Anaerolineae bacterium]
MISVIVPVFNGGSRFLRCLKAIRQSSFTDFELIIVDDGSNDGSGQLARQFSERVFATPGATGPGAARNLGARLARGDILFFTDADCAVHPDTLAKVAAIFQANPALDALIGSYDDAPGAPNFVAQYKNLFHHYVHQTASEEAGTFWGACGAMRRERYLALGGFDVQRYRRPSIEDIELGYRLKQAGGRIRLAKEVQVKHLKAWTLPSLLKTDILDRGIPWTQLLLRDRVFSADLNLQTHNRISVVAVYGLLLALLAGLWQPLALLVAALLALLLLALNFNLYRFFARRRGWWFALRTIPLHWLYYFYNAISFAAGAALHLYERLRPETVTTPDSVTDRVEPDGG